MGSWVREVDACKEESLSIAKIADILAAHDPEALIKMGAPPDEYIGEATSIFNGLLPLLRRPQPVSLYELVDLVETRLDRAFSSSRVKKKPGYRNRYHESSLVFIAYEIAQLNWSPQ